jgi:hypothetical protein
VVPSVAVGTTQTATSCRTYTLILQFRFESALGKA